MEETLAYYVERPITVMPAKAGIHPCAFADGRGRIRRHSLEEKSTSLDLLWGLGEEHPPIPKGVIPRNALRIVS